MKFRVLYFIYIFFIFAFFGCGANSDRAGHSLIGVNDEVLVKNDSFGFYSTMTKGSYVEVTPDSLLLGECDNLFGTMHADILTQLTCPIGYEYPENAKMDSACLFIYYKTYFGDGNSPMNIVVYEMDKGTFDYTTAYPSNVDVSDFCSLDASTRLSQQDKILAAAHCPDSALTNSSSYVYFVRIKLNDEFAQRLFELNNIPSQKDFNEAIKGIYITTNFGGATMLYITDISVNLYYSFSYKRYGKDTTIQSNKGFYATSEVRQINRYIYQDMWTEEQLRAVENDYNYVVSPVNMTTELHFPFKELQKHFVRELNGRRPYVNRARLRLDVLNVYEGATADITRDDWAQPAPTMLLVKKDALNRFFLNRELPSDTCAIYSTLSYDVDASNNVHYYYEYDMSSLLTQYLHSDMSTDTLKMVLVPITLNTAYSSTSGTTTVNSVSLDQRITATTIRSAQNSVAPLKLHVVYSGF